MTENNKKLIDNALLNADEIDIEQIAINIKSQYEFDIEEAMYQQLKQDIRMRLSAIKDKDGIREYYAIAGETAGKYMNAPKTKSPLRLRATANVLTNKAQGLLKSVTKLNSLAFKAENQYKMLGRGKNLHVGLEYMEE